MHAYVLTTVSITALGSIALTQLRPTPTPARHAVAAASPVLSGGPVIGPDCIVSRMDNLAYWGSVGDIGGYSIATTSCNIGDETLLWLDEDPNTGEDNQNLHPVIAQNLYRLKDGRFEQIGMSWVKHGFCAADANDPFNCIGCTPIFDCDLLYPGCSDTYSTINNASQYWLGPRSDINATTGEYPYPYTINWRDSGSSIFKRIQVHDDEFDPTMNAGARYFAEGQYITVDEQPWGTDDNNNSWREFQVDGPLSGGFGLSYVDTIRQQESAILAWQEVNGSVVIETVDVPDDGRVLVAYLVTDNGDGTWTYEFAINNYNSDQGIGRVTIPVDCADLTNVGFHDVEYHSGEPWDGTDWPDSFDSGNLTWQTTDFATNPNANALRWGTLYNYRFTADQPPVAGMIELGMFKPGTAASVAVSALVPQPRVCPADIVVDGSVGIQDLLHLLANWGSAGSADFTGPNECPDGVAGILELLGLLDAWGPC